MSYVSFFLDELVNTIEPGKAYEVIGICRTDVLGDDITVTLEVHSASYFRFLMKHMIRIYCV